MDEKGNRNPDSNLCVSSKEALDIAAENAVKIAAICAPPRIAISIGATTGFPGAGCPQCRGLGDSDQALILENRILKALRFVDPGAQLAHLAYANSLVPPGSVKPDPGIFLEYAPINRRFDIPLKPPMTKSRKRTSTRSTPTWNSLVWKRRVGILVDVSLFSRWKRPAVKCLSPRVAAIRSGRLWETGNPARNLVCRIYRCRVY
jgi:hypothetical protein